MWPVERKEEKRLTLQQRRCNCCIENKKSIIIILLLSIQYKLTFSLNSKFMLKVETYKNTFHGFRLFV